MTLKQQHKKFCKLYISGKGAAEAYKEAYNCSDLTASKKCYLLLEKTEIKAYINELQTKIDKEIYQEVKDNIVKTEVNHIMTAIDKRIFLSKIIKAEEDIEDYVILRGIAINFKRKPNISERLKAMEIDNKLSGDNAPVKNETVLQAESGINITFTPKEDTGFNEEQL